MIASQTRQNPWSSPSILAGALLLLSTILAMWLSNGQLSVIYQRLLMMPVSFSINHYPLLEKPFLLWVNDGLMSLFFLLIALEIKEALFEGHFQTWRDWNFPLSLALGGILMPIAIYFWMNLGITHHYEGWAIPTATDVAFSLGILALFGDRVPTSLKLILMTLAIFDDIASILIIAVYYTENLSWLSMIVGTIFVLCLVLLNRCRVKNLTVYMFVGLLLWFCVLKSGVHATLAGVVMAFCIPYRIKSPRAYASFLRKPDKKLNKQFMKALQPWVGFLIVPLFGLMNAGVSLSNVDASILMAPVTLGVTLGLCLGKPFGILLFGGVALWLDWAKMPEDIHWRQWVAIAFLAGIGFTMSLFIATLAFDHGEIILLQEARLGILMGSLISGTLGILLLSQALPSSRWFKSHVYFQGQEATPPMLTPTSYSTDVARHFDKWACDAQQHYSSRIWADSFNPYHL